MKKYDTEFTVPDSEYADDTAFAFCSRDDLQHIAPLIIHHFSRWGLEVHVGSRGGSSKSEVLFCAASARSYVSSPATYDGADLSDILLPGGYHLPVVDHFKYLGSFLSRDCKDNYDVDSRIQSAGKAFGALRKCLFSSSSVSYAAKRAVYTGVVLSILLYGCECWALTERLLHRLRLFHAQCLRTMCRVTRKHTWEHHISTQKLCEDLSLQPIEFYIAHRQLTWLGHVGRMGFNRLPRRMLSAWVNHPRPKGAPEMTYGRAVNKALKRFEIPVSDWSSKAGVRAVWKQTIRASNYVSLQPRRRRQ